MRRKDPYCVACPPEMGCLGRACPNRRPVATYVCDSCGEEGERSDLRMLGGEALCKDCFLESAWENADEPQETYDYDTED